MNKKKLLALLMALVMTLSLVPVTALAETETASASTTGYNGEKLPAGPEMTGDVINVTAVNAQYVLDGAYGNINGKTINFTQDVTAVLELGRPTKYEGSGSTYLAYHLQGGLDEGDPRVWSAEYLASISESSNRYWRTVDGVTFTANTGVTLRGFHADSGHHYNGAYDYVRDVNVESGSAYYQHTSLNNITFRNLTFAGGEHSLDFGYAGADAADTVSGITIEGCSFSNTDKAAIRYQADNYHIDNTTVKNCTFNNVYQGVYLHAPNGATIQNNVVNGTTHNAFALQTTYQKVLGTILISGNYIAECGDRAIKFGNIDSSANITINNNVFLKTAAASAETDVIKDASGGDAASVNLDNNYWNGAEAEAAVQGTFTAPTAVGIISGTFPVNVSAYCAEGYTATESNGIWTVGPAAATTNVAEINGTKYATLAAAFAAAADGDTITLLADCAGDGIKAPQGKFTNGLTVDFANHTYTVDGETVGSTGTETNGFQLLKENKITFKNGTITSAKAKILVQNYSNLTLKDMTLTLNNPDYSSAYTLSNNNGNVLIDDTTINANPAGGFAFDVCRFSSYPSVNVTVTGNSTINGDVEISASKSDAKDGFSLTLSSGTITGDIVMHASAAAAVAAAPEKVSITKSDAFEQDAPAGYKWKETDPEGTYVLALSPIKYYDAWNPSSVYYFADEDQIPSRTTQCTVPKIKREGESSYHVAEDWVNIAWYVTDSSAKAYTGTSTTIASVNENGLVTFTAPGSVKVWLVMTDHSGVEKSAYKSISYKVAPAYIVRNYGKVAYATLSSAFNDAQSGETIVMGADYSVTGTVGTKSLTDGRVITIDLQGHTASIKGNYSAFGALFTVKNGTLNMIDTVGNGSVAAIGKNARAFNVDGRANTVATDDAVLNIGPGVNVSSTADCCVTVFGKGTLNTAGNLSSPASFAIAGNGTEDNGGYTINVTGGEVSSVDAPAIYHCNSGTLKVSGGTITGATGIYQKSGTMNITGGTITGNGDKAEYSYNGNGANATGDAIVIDNCDYPGGAPTASITGGKFASEHADAVGSYCGNTATAAITNFITGGKFSTNPSTYVADGYEAVSITGESPYTHQVGKVKATELSEDKTQPTVENQVVYTATKSVVDTQTGATLSGSQEESFRVTVEAPASGLDTDKESMSLSNVKKEEIVALAVDKASEAGKNEASVQIQLATESLETTGSVVKFDVHPEAVISVYGQEPATVKLTNDQITGSFTFKLNVGTGMGSQVKVTHVHDDGTVEDLGIKEVVNGYITLVGIKSFSEFWSEPVTVNTTTGDSNTYFEYVGASLRRRVNTSAPTVVLNTSTDIRFQYTLKNYETNKTKGVTYFFQWSKDNSSWKTVPVKQFSAVDSNGNCTASLVINGVPSGAFGSPIYTRIYAVDSEGESYMLTPGTDRANTVNAVAGIIAGPNSTQEIQWINYAKYLLGGLGVDNYTVSYGVDGKPVYDPEG